LRIWLPGLVSKIEQAKLSNDAALWVGAIPVGDQIAEGLPKEK
jgi:hypothetical protein